MTITDNEFNNIYGIGIRGNTMMNGEIANNNFKDIGLVQGYGIAFSDTPINNYVAVAFFTAKSSHVHHNRVENTGYAGIRIDGDDNLVERNYIKDALQTMNDAGGLYCWGTNTFNSTIQYNIVDGVSYNLDGMPADKGIIAVGIYLDNNANNVTVQHNTVANVPWAFFTNTGGHSNIIRNNTFYNFEIQGALFFSDAPPDESFDHVFEDNLLVGFDVASPMVIKQTNNTVDDFIPGTFSDNTYFNPYGDTFFQSKKFGGEDVTRTLNFEEWKTELGSDATSTNPFWGWNDHDITSVLSGNLISNGEFETGTSGWSSFTPSGSSVTLSHESPSALDGGALKFEHDNSSSSFGLALHPNIAYEAAKYQLSFSIISTQNGAARVIPKRHFSPFDRISDARRIAFLDGIRKEYDYTFEVDQDIDPGRLDFEIDPEDGNFTLDNVVLRRVNAQAIDLTSEIVLFYNDSDNNVDVVLTEDYIDLDQNPVSSPLSLAPWSSKVLARVRNSILPVTLLSFTAALEKEGVILDWQTASEVNNKGFEVEKSSDAKIWKPIGFVDGHGDAIDEQLYTFRDKNPIEGINYYRLKQIDFDGAFEYSKIVSVNYSLLQNGKQPLVYPNPFDNQLTIEANQSGFEQIWVVNILGQDVTAKVGISRQSNTQVLLDTSALQTGWYFIQTSKYTHKAFKK